MSGRPWSTPDEIHAVTLRRAGFTLREIGEVLGRSGGSVDSKLRWLKRERNDIIPAGQSERVSAALIAERDRRSHAYDLRDLTAKAFGDPPPGYSALDRMGAR